MDGNLKFHLNCKLHLGRESIGFLLVFFLLFSSGPAGGKEAINKKRINPWDLLRLVPVLKTVMLETDSASATSAGSLRQETPAGIKDNNSKHMEEERYQVRWGDTCWSIANRYGMSLAELTALNPGLNPGKIKSGQYLQIRRGVVTSTANRGRSGPRSTPGATQLALFHPLRGARLTSRYGMRWGRPHRGIDLAAPLGTPIVAAAPGRVTFAGWQNGYGLLVIIDHGSFETKYAHNTENLVQVGEEVLRGQPVAKVGRTGNATGNHLHFELVIGNLAVDPLPYLR